MSNYAFIVTLIAMMSLVGNFLLIRRLKDPADGDDNEMLRKENYELRRKMDEEHKTIDKVRTEVIRVRDKASNADLDSLINMLP
jgi:hypothetical protein